MESVVEVEVTTTTTTQDEVGLIGDLSLAVEGLDLLPPPQQEPGVELGSEEPEVKVIGELLTRREWRRRRRLRKTVDKRFKFCPSCHNILQVKVLNKGKELCRRHCVTCPYIQPIKRKHKYPVHKFKEEEEEADIVETSKADEHRQRTEVICPKCSHKEAFFYQMQTRSADEPMTNFYECVNKECRNNWRD